MEKILSKIKKIHFIGISGAGMSGLARLFYDKGAVVTGSDISLKGYLCGLDKLVKVFCGHSGGNITDVDAVCFSSAIGEDNAELLEARKRNLCVLHRSDLLALIVAANKSIAVSGSHGKTTVTALLSYVLKRLGDDPSAIIGGVPRDYEYNAWWGNGHFVFEADESDGSFLKYKPCITVITNIDADHLDYYTDIKAVYNAFEAFAANAKDRVVVCGDNPLTEKISSIVGAVRYGMADKNDVRAENIEYTDRDVSFDIVCRDKKVKVSVQLFGRHNVYNVLAVFSVMDILGFDLQKVSDAVGDFSGIKRRLEICSRAGSVTFFDDYAHHPTEISAVLDALRHIGNKRIIVLFEPHRFSRIEKLYADFVKCFKGAYRVFVTDVYSASEQGYDIDYDKLAADIAAGSKVDTVYFPSDRFVSSVADSIVPESIVIGVGAGNITEIVRKIAYSFGAENDL
ncbi:MAG: UDP-N-acetylmuramate--L-alanine ligase [Candidatus Omnitrophica bacterium]|nr:UDP-N-acetylmuramate--L-alanine ligase [Candidatus Omnitrophota bacterium]